MEVITSSSRHAAPAPSEVLEAIVFSLGEQEYGIDIRHVEELRGHDDVIPVEKAPGFVSGSISLRGGLVPLIDMHALLGLSPAAGNRFSDIIVVGTARSLTALGVAGIVGVETLLPGQISPAAGSLLQADLLLGIGHGIDNRTLPLIDIDSLLGNSWLRPSFMLQ